MVVALKLCLVHLNIRIEPQVFNSFVIKRLIYLKVPPGALFQSILFVFSMLRFQNNHCGEFYNIYIDPKAPPGGPFLQ